MASTRISRVRRTSLAIAATALLTMAMAACDSSDDGATPEGSSSATAPADSSSATEVVLENAWAKAADSGMTAIFGTLHNTSDHDVTITAGTTDAATTVELHEVVDKDGAMVMQPKEGGFVIPAGGTHELAPGGDHIMLMELTRPLVAGDSLEASLTTADDETITVTAEVRTFDGGEEHYSGGMSDDETMMP